MREAVAAFLRHLERERNASPHTLRAYGEDLAQFSDYLKRELGRAARPADVDHLLVRGFLAELHARGLRKSSSARKLAGLRSFFRYLCREGRLERNPARALQTPRQERRIPEVLDEAQAASLVELPGSSSAAIRGRAILELLYGTGIRCAEAVALDVHELDLDARMVRVLGKGRKERVVLFGRRAADALSAWLVERAGLAPRGDALFLNARGGRLSGRSVRALVARRSAPRSSRWVAKLWRSVCGLQRRASATCLTRRATSARTLRPLSRPPRAFRNSASLRGRSSLRSSSQVVSARCARRPKSTTRCLRPLPRTRSMRASRSSSWTSSATASAQRMPVP